MFELSYHNTTTIHPVGLAALLICSALLLVLPRRHAVLPFVIIAVFIPSAQRLVVAGLDFTFLRIAAGVGLLRIVIRREAEGFRNTPLDSAVLVWAAVATVTHVLQRGTPGALINRLGYVVDTAGVYFVFRCLLRNKADIQRVVRTFVGIALPVFVLFLIEKATANNLFSVFGGVPEITAMRQGRLRVQGAFAHPILAGAFWATLLPLIASRWYVPWRDRSKTAAITILFGLLILLTASSTPILGALVGIACFAAYPLRAYAKWLPIYAVIAFIVLDLGMDAPVWHLISRIDLSGGSTGWHRYNLINQAILNFPQWVFLGTESIDSWNVFANDITNHYILEAVRGGVFTLIAFIWVLFEALRLGFRLSVHYEAIGLPADSRLAWSMVAMIAIHAANFIAVSYFGEILMLQYLGYAMIGSLSAHEIYASGLRHGVSGIARYETVGLGYASRSRGSQ